MPVCSECGHHLKQDSFSKNQRSKGSAMRCFACVSGGNPGSTSQAAETPRCNNSTRASSEQRDLDHPLGAFRWVSRGTYTECYRRGQGCVCKWFQFSQVFEKDFFENDINAVDKALVILRMFNAAGIVDKSVRLNIPEVWTFEPHSRLPGRKVLQEPFVEKWEELNHNSDWGNGETPRRVMQALSYFSYHATSGSAVLCDLQGGICMDRNVLSDPVIL